MKPRALQNPINLSLPTSNLKNIQNVCLQPYSYKYAVWNGNPC